MMHSKGVGEKTTHSELHSYSLIWPQQPVLDGYDKTILTIVKMVLS